ncbi:golgin subfamily A member 6-like protein 2 [Protopterus annectens]|uniref:golgin subfamily A member 6-like protein 2 n=1 Tax=Protopterus annectens TaxID=7888 RepID=UPI001CFA672A|nr:golgin subfamily A member 6-like protein 2 [Protopterus annectens]
MSSTRLKHSVARGGTVRHLGFTSQKSFGSAHAHGKEELETSHCITGVAMAVPETKSHSFQIKVEKMRQHIPPAESAQVKLEKLKEHTPPTTKKNKMVVNKSVQTYATEKNIQECKELLVKCQVLEAQLMEKEDTIRNLNQSLQNKNTEFVKAVEIEQRRHEETKCKMKRTETLLMEKAQLLQDTTNNYEETIQKLKKEHEEAVAILKMRSESEINHRDNKITNLKKQISDILKGKSWERQQQLEELRKELENLTEEAQFLQRKLKEEQLNKQECANCRSMAQKLEEKTLQLRLKERTVEELQAICRKTEKQLAQQVY